MQGVGVRGIKRGKLSSWSSVYDPDGARVGGTTRLDCLSLLSGVTLRGFHSLVSEGELGGKTQASGGKRNGRPLRQGAGPKRKGHKSMKGANTMLKGGRHGADSSQGKNLSVKRLLLSNENPTPNSLCDYEGATSYSPIQVAGYRSLL